MEADRKKPKLEDDDPFSAANCRNVRRRIPIRTLGKKFSSTRLQASSKMWARTVPTQNCDVVVTLPAKTQDSTIMWLLARLRSRTPKLLVSFKHHGNAGIYALYMTASYQSLLDGAEELALPKPLSAEFGGGMKEFILEDRECFEGVDDEEHFFTSQERQCIVRHMLDNLRAVAGEEVDGVKFVEGQPIVPKLQSKGIVLGVFPLHSYPCLNRLRRTWIHAVFSAQPLDLVCEYFGSKIGMYFAYLDHYTRWLLVPAVFGILYWCIQTYDESWDDVTWVIFSIFNVFWATVFLRNWKRTSSTYAFHWSTLDRKDDLLKDPRPLYKGDLQMSPITGRMEPYYPAWKRNLFHYFVSLPIISFFLGIVFTTMLLIFQLQEWVNSRVTEDWYFYSGLRFLPKVLLAVVSCILDELYGRVAKWLNNKENYRLQETHETNLVIKLVLFQFVNSFLSLFYIAFYLRDMNRLREMLAALLITRQVVGNVKEVLVPLFMWKVRLYNVGFRMAHQSPESARSLSSDEASGNDKQKVQSPTSPDRDIRKRANALGKEQADNSDNSAKTVNKVQKPEDTASNTSAEENSLTQVEVENAMAQYDDTFQDYLEMVIQFGYVILFSSAFPLAALFAFLNNLIEVRSDAFKLCYTLQRPFGARVEDSGIWQDVLNVIVIIAVIVNSAMVGLGGHLERLAPNLSETEHLLVIICVEHFVLAMKLYVEYAIPEFPHWIATEMAKTEFQRREALKRLEQQAAVAFRSGRELDPGYLVPGSLGASMFCTGSSTEVNKPCHHNLRAHSMERHLLAREPRDQSPRSSPKKQEGEEHRFHDQSLKSSPAVVQSQVPDPHNREQTLKSTSRSLHYNTGKQEGEKQRSHDQPLQSSPGAVQDQVPEPSVHQRSLRSSSRSAQLNTPTPGSKPSDSALYHELVSHWPRDHSSNHPQGRVKSSESSTVDEGESDRKGSSFSFGSGQDSINESSNRSPWQQEGQVVGRTFSRSTFRRSILRRMQFGKSRSLETAVSAFMGSRSLESSAASTSDGSSLPSKQDKMSSLSDADSLPLLEEAVSSHQKEKTFFPSQHETGSQKETTFYPCGATVTYLPGSIGQIVDTDTSSQSGPSETCSQSSVLDSSVDLPRYRDAAVDP